jgi:SAM-dependent methyltransferase
MNKSLLSILVDPLDHTSLTLENGVFIGDSEIVEGTLKGTSGRTYPIVNGIPRFVGQDNYTDGFGMQWNRFAKTQLDSSTGLSYSRDRFENEVRWDRKWAENKLILDAGCGAGRFSEIAADYGCQLVSIDMSSAVDAVKQNLAGKENVNIVQASILQLPFRPGTFDGFYCIGVIQHTPDPLKVIRNLLQAIKPGGQFAMTIYARRLWTKLYSKYWVRKLINGISDEKLLSLVERMMSMLFPITNVLFRIPVIKKLFRFLIPVANYVEKKDMTRQQLYEEAVLDTFDMLSPAYDNPLKASEVIEILHEFDINDYQVITKRPVNVLGRK